MFHAYVKLPEGNQDLFVWVMGNVEGNAMKLIWCVVTACHGLSCLLRLMWEPTSFGEYKDWDITDITNNGRRSTDWWLSQPMQKN